MQAEWLVTVGSVGGPIALGIAAVATALQFLFGSLFGGPDLSGVQKAITQLRDQLSTAIDVLKRFAWSIGRLALAGILAISVVVSDLIDEITKALRAIYEALKRTWTNIIAPALDALHKLRKILNDIYNNWLRPVINAIQQIRRILAILRAFGFKWAGALDARLARIEAKIIAPYLWLIRQLNGYGQWINIIITLKGVLQRGLFYNSNYRYIGWLTNLWWVSQAGGLGTPRGVTPQPQPVAPSKQQVLSDFDAFARFGYGPYAEGAQLANSLFLIELGTE